MSDLLTWTDDRVARLKELYAAGLSASQIANDLAGGVTRNAVIGKVLRLKLPARGRRIAAPRLDKPIAPPRPKPGKFTAAARAPSFRRANPSHSIQAKAEIRASDPGLVDPSPAVLHEGRGVKLIELTNSTCRWPFGDPHDEYFMFCGEPSANLEEKRPYCPFHSARAVDRTGTIRSATRTKDAALAAAR